MNFPNTVQGLIYAIIVIGIVFFVLIALWGVLELFGIVFYKKEKGVPSSSSAPMRRSSDGGELIAVITAAVASSLNTSTYNLNIKSIKRTGSTASEWNAASRKENIYGRM